MTQISKQRPRTPRQAARRPGPIDERLNPLLFKALCDPTRTALIACIAKCGRPCTVSEVAACCHVDFSVVSRHLSLLARSGVLESQKSGRTMHYSVRYRDLCHDLRALADAFESCCPPDAGCDGPGACRGGC